MDDGFLHLLMSSQLAYNPIDTTLYRLAQALSGRGWIAMHGLEVLAEQDITQLELFPGREAPQHLMRPRVKLYLDESPDID